MKKMTLAKVLTNKTVLNIVFVIALLTVVGYLMIGDIQSVILFILSVLSIGYFSKNMIVVLGVSIMLVALFSMRNRRVEGMEINKEKKDIAEKKSDDEKEPNHVIDKDATQSAAYADLEDTVGSEGIKKIATHTSSLVTQQRELMGNMNEVNGMMDKVEPMMARLESMMDKMNSFGGGAGANLGGMMKKMQK